MSARLLPVVALLLACEARAHAVDEYLQAALLSLDDGRVRVALRMVPGVDVLPEVVQAIDGNEDGTISPAEQRSYAERVRDDLMLSIDGAPLALEPVAVEFPSMAQMREGLGEIRIELVADSEAGSGEHALAFENRHLARISAYLANTLVLPDGPYRIVAQQRSTDQSSYDLTYRR